MTVEEIIQSAIERASHFTPHYPSGKASMIRRISTRQRELFARAARLNPERFGACATAVLDARFAADLQDIQDPIPAPELIQRITITDPGTSAYAVGDEVNIVTIADASAEMPPRATIRDLVLRPVGTDLDGVVEIAVWYSRVPAAIPSTGLAGLAELPSPHDELLVVDLARWLVQRATETSPEVRAAAVAAFAAEEAEGLVAFDAQVTDYGPWRSRFAEPPAAPEKG